MRDCAVSVRSGEGLTERKALVEQARQVTGRARGAAFACQLTAHCRQFRKRGYWHVDQWPRFGSEVELFLTD